MSYNLRRIPDGAGDNGSMSIAYRVDETKSTFKMVEVDNEPTIGCYLRVGSPFAGTYSKQDYWTTTPILEIISVDIIDDTKYYRFKTKNSVYDWWTSGYPIKDKKNSIIHRTFDKLKYSTLKQSIDVINEIYFINTISESGYRDGIWREEEEDPTLDKLYSYSRAFTTIIINIIEDADKNISDEDIFKLIKIKTITATNMLLNVLGYRTIEYWTPEESTQMEVVKTLAIKHYDQLIESYKKHKLYNTNLK